jgi:hypothetical protein
MAKFDSPLKNLKIASPCPADWDAMSGDERKRFCGDCKLNVYNLSDMTKYDAENLLRNAEGRLCVRYFQRPDGTILTQDCPVGWAKAKQRMTVFATAAFALVVSFFGSIFVLSLFGKKIDIGKRLPIPFATPTPRLLMGAIAMPSPSPKSSPSPKPKTGVVELKGEIERVDMEEEIRREVRKAAGV